MKYLLLLILMTSIISGCARTSDLKIDAVKTQNSYISDLFVTTNQTQLYDKHSSQLEYLINSALRNNPSILSSEQTWLAAQEQISAVRVIPDTVIGFSYSPLPIESRNGQIVGGVTLSQRIIDSDKLESAETVQFQNATIQKMNYNRKKQEIEFAVKNTYYSLYYIDKQIEIQKIRQAFLQQLEKVIIIRVKTGKIDQADLLKIQNEIAKLKTEIEILMARRSTVNAKLNILIGANFNENTDVHDQIELKLTKIDISKVMETALVSNPGLQAKEAEIVKALKQIKQIEASFNSDYLLGLKYQIITEAESISPDRGSDNLTFSFGLNLALFNGWRISKLKSAEYEVIAIKYEKTHYENLLIANILDQYFKLSSAKQRYELLNSTIIPRAKQILNITEQDYQIGKSDFIELIDSTRNLFSYRMQSENSKTEYLLAMAALDMFQGKSITENITGKRNDK